MNSDEESIISKHNYNLSKHSSLNIKEKDMHHNGDLGATDSKLEQENVDLKLQIDILKESNIKYDRINKEFEDKISENEKK